jgi:hypothetical protein
MRNSEKFFTLSTRIILFFVITLSVVLQTGFTDAMARGEDVNTPKTIDLPVVREIEINSIFEITNPARYWD